MLIQRVNRTDAEQIELIVVNAAGATATTGRALMYVGGTGAMVASTDGANVAILDADGSMCMLAGIASQDIPNTSAGRCLAWGYASSIELSAEANKTIGVTALVETFLKVGAVAGTFTSTQTPQALSTFAYKYVQTMTTTNISGGLVYASGFVRAL
jgi:hypothetical protein